MRERQQSCKKKLTLRRNISVGIPKMFAETFSELNFSYSLFFSELKTLMFL